MPGTIEQSIHFEATTEQLYRTYVDSDLHSAAVGNDVKVGAEAGAEFRAFGGVLTGQILTVVPNSMVVQLWRSTNFNAEDLDSILILKFIDEDSGARIDLIHTNLPDHEIGPVADGWKKFYWDPWTAYLAST